MPEIATKRRILVLTDHFSPGYKAGGVIRTVENTVARLGSRFEFRILTRNRDFGDREAYPGVPSGRWTEGRGCAVLYAAVDGISALRMLRFIRGAGHDLLHLNSFFSPVFSLLPLLFRRLGLLPDVPVVVAPRGELSPGALSIKPARKRVCLAAARWLGLHRGVIFQASAPLEEREIKACLGPRARVAIAPDLPSPTERGPEGVDPRAKPAQSLRAVFLSRVSRKKNLDGALRVLTGLRLPLTLDVYGPREDEAYWEECRALIAGLDGPSVNYRGMLRPEEVVGALSGYDLFYLPTHGENFGHVILEALTAGCPVLISDATPWRGLREKGAGWDLPLEDMEGFRMALEECFRMDGVAHGEMRRRAREVAAAFQADHEVEEMNARIFEDPERPWRAVLAEA